MAQYQGLSSSIFNEPEYRDGTELLVSMYIMLNRDMAGVCPMRESVVAEKCFTTVRKLRLILDRFEEIGKVEIAPDRTHVWLKSGIAHSLYQGKFSEQQLSRVIATLKKWENTGVFSENFAVRAAQHVATKYSIKIPYTANLNLTESKTKTKEEEPAAVAAPLSGAAQSVVDKFHECCPSLPRVLKLTGPRTRSILRHSRDHPQPNFWDDLFRRVNATPFLLGENERGWQADLDFILKPKVLIKILEGSYDRSSRSKKLGAIREGFTPAGGIKAPQGKYDNL